MSTDRQKIDQPDRVKPKPQWRRVGFIALILLLIGGGYRLRQSNAANRADKFLTHPVERQTLPVTISANGVVSAERSINLSPKTAGVVKTLFIKEGDRVVQGQVIAAMDDSNLRGQLIQMQGQLAQQMANLKRLQAGNRREDIAKVAAQVAEASANLQQLRAGNCPQEIDRSRARVRQVQAKLSQLQTNRTEEIAQAQFQLDAAKSRTKLAQQRIEST